jgi:predicted transcriptional regulator
MAAHKPSIPRPTQGELEILSVLWQRGPSTVREAQEALSGTRTSGYTTVLKLLQIMSDKGLVTRDETQRTHVYSAAVPQDQTQRQLVTDLLDRAFDGSAMELVMHALASQKTSAAEIARIRQLLDELEGGSR